MVCPGRSRSLVLAQRTLLLLTTLVALSTTTTAQSSWERFGPEGGYVHRFTQHSSRLFAATHAGIWVRGITGGPWQEVGSIEQFSHVYAVRSAGDSLLAACETGLFISGWEGTSWRSVSPDVSEIRNLRDFLDMSDAWFVVSNPGGVYRSTDIGATWVKLTVPGAGGAFNTIQRYGDRIYLGSDLGAFTSDDLGETWTRFSDYSTDDFAFHGEQIIRCGEVTEASLDNGETWRRVTPNSSVTAVIDEAGSWYVGCSALRGTYRSDDRGASWVRIDENLPVRSSTALAMYSDSLYVGQGNHGLWMSADRGQTWVSADHGMYGVYVHDIVATDSTLTVGTNYRGLHHSIDHGETWTHRFDYARVFALDEHEGVMIAGGNDPDAFLAVSTNGGSTFTSRTYDEHDFIVHVFSNDSGLFYSASNALYMSRNQGQQWKRIGAGLPSKLFSGLVPLDTGLAIGCVGLQGPDQSFFTTNHVEGTWEPLSSFFISGTSLHEMIRSDSSIYLATGNGAMRLSTRTTMFPTYIITGSQQCLALCARGDTLFLTSVSRDDRNWIQTSNDRGTTLSDVSGEFAEGTFTAIASDERYLYVALGEGGLVRRPLREVVVSIAESMPVVATEDMVSVYPNPMSGTTCSITVHSAVGPYDVDVYTLDGRRIDAQCEPTDSGSQIRVPESGRGTYLIRVRETVAPYRHFIRIVQRR